VWLLQAFHSFGTVQGYLLLLLLVACVKGILSPLIFFVICMEFLSHDILKVVELKHWKLVSISHNGMSLSHLFLEDDVLLFTKATRYHAIMVEGILTNFTNMLGLKVNISKSKAFFSDTTRRSKIESMVATTGIRQTFSLETLELLWRPCSLSSHLGSPSEMPYTQILCCFAIQVQNLQKVTKTRE